ncbi:hypothetical protein GFS24_28065 [Chitinophaga sp. SYP-B3965]|uniref:hypothetical protein n=1 Tax=Chitinophaga sp. SYP-B3965 TaxID=2663120 RepID=UPI0012999D28|nr:hypothetical protein [Chitinophaga sp. SYP-B3965]MRG48997.1 hypothetical protein [Chitinophaga sp. SYP-B3965]
MKEFIYDFRFLLETAAKCKQDFAYWQFFKKQDYQLSIHFHKLSEDYLRLLLIDLHALLSRSEYDKYSFRYLFSRLQSNIYHEQKITDTNITRWINILDKHEQSIEKVRKWKIQKIEYGFPNPGNPTMMSTKEFQLLVIAIEFIIIEICCIEELGLPNLATIEDRFSHTVADGFKRIELEKQVVELSKKFSNNEAGINTMRTAI